MASGSMPLTYLVGLAVARIRGGWLGEVVEVAVAGEVGGETSVIFTVLPEAGLRRMRISSIPASV